MLTQPIIDVLPDHISILDHTGSIVAVNEAWRAFADANQLGWNDYGVGANYFSICEAATGDDAMSARATLQGLRDLQEKKRTVFSLEYPCHSPQEKRWFLLRATLFDDGGHERFLIAHLNITKRRLAEESAKQHLTFLHTVMEAIPHPLLVIDTSNHQIQLANSAAFPGALRGGMTCHQLSHHQDKPCDSTNDPCPIEIVKQTGKPKTVEHVHYRTDGTFSHLEVNCFPILDDAFNVSRVVELSIDITQRKRIEQNLKNSEKKFKCLTSSAIDPIIMIDENGNIILWNEAAQKVFGYWEKEALGKNIHQLIAPQGYHDVADKGFKSFVKTGCGPAVGKTIELEAVRKDGTLFPVELSVSSADLDERRHAVGIVRDISERKQAEKELLDAKTNIENLYLETRRDYDIAQTVLGKISRGSAMTVTNVKHHLAPMDVVGGDLFLSHTYGSGKQYFFLGDFTGHGLSAAIGAIPAADIFYAMTERNCAITDIAAEINRKLKGVLPTGLFLCAFLAELDHDHGTMVFCNSGMPEAFVIGKHGGIKERLPSKNLPLGILSDDDFVATPYEISLTCGDRIFLGTDGLIEASDKKGNIYGQSRLEAQCNSTKEIDNLFDNIVNDFRSFVSDTPQQDDITFVEILCKEGALSLDQSQPVKDLRNTKPFWKFTSELGIDVLRSTLPFAPLVDLIVGIHEDLRGHSENINLILSELLNNALDYGVLGLDGKMKQDIEGFDAYHVARQKALVEQKTGWIKVELEIFRKPKGWQLVTKVQDSGQGFDYSKLGKAPVDTTLLSKRGIFLINKLCKELLYNDLGNQVQATYEF